MAGDWVKMRSALLANPKVHAIAKAVGRDSRAGVALTTGYNGAPDAVLSRHALRHVTVTALLCVWSAANEHSNDGKLSCCDLDDIDEIAGVPGFGEAMSAVGWAVRDKAENCVLLPNFSEHNTTAKDRTAAERQRRFRCARNGGVTRDSNAVTVTQRREEKRREEIEEPAAPVATGKPRTARPAAPCPVTWTASEGWAGITDDDRKAWAEAYPGVVLEQELAKATAWLKANPQRAGKRNWRAFVVRWLSKCQERGGTVRTQVGAPQVAPPKVWKDDYRPAPYRRPKELAGITQHLQAKEGQE